MPTERAADGPAGAPGVFVIVTCEHGGNQVPQTHRGLFAGAEDVLAGHRGHDPGSLGVATQMAARLSAPLLACLTTRLLVEPNRSLDHPDLFSSFSRGLPEATRRGLVAEIYAPHRAAVERSVRLAADAGHHVVHVGVHTFTDVLDGVRRGVDVGVLFDPARVPERDLADAWLAAIASARPDLRCAPNEPYLGTDDGLTTTLRGGLDAASYTGLEIEVRQGLVAGDDEQRAMGDLLAGALREALARVRVRVH